MSSNLKPGDRALLLPQADGDPEVEVYNWTVVVITSHLIRAEYNVNLIHEFDFYDGSEGFATPEYLLRIPPDSEARQMFRETEKTKEAA